MPTSRLWQRIRSARKAADLTQSQIAAVCGVSRAAVAYWESQDAAQRTRPSVDQLVKLAKLAKVPVEWFVDEQSDPDKVWEFMDRSVVGVATRDAPIAQATTRDRLADNFWRAVEFAVVDARPEVADRFGRVFEAGRLQWTADYIGPKDVVVFGSACENPTCLVGRLMCIQAIVGRALHLHLLVWDRDARSQLEGVGGPLHVDVGVVSTVDEASGLLLGM